MAKRAEGGRRYTSVADFLDRFAPKRKQRKKPRKPYPASTGLTERVADKLGNKDA